MHFLDAIFFTYQHRSSASDWPVFSIGRRPIFENQQRLQVKTILHKLLAYAAQEDSLRLAWKEYKAHSNKGLAVEFALKAQNVLDNKQLEFEQADELIEKIYLKGLAYYKLSMIYLWAGKFEEAFSLDDMFLTRMHWNNFSGGIARYLEMLIIKKQTTRLNNLFADDDFKVAFITQYEAFITLLIYPDQEISDQHAFNACLLRMNETDRNYCNGKWL